MTKHETGLSNGYSSTCKRWGLLLAALLHTIAGPAQTPTLAAADAPDEAAIRYHLERSVSMPRALFVSRPERRQVFGWAAGAGARFIGRLSCFWYTPESVAQEQAYFDSTRQAVAELRALHSDAVAQGTVFEIVYAHVGNLPVPNVLRAEFGEDTVAVPRRKFNFAAMMYPGYFAPIDSAGYRYDSRPPDQAPGVPDMSQPETQLWFYYRARRQLDTGCEALHFGQVMRMDDRDPGHQGWWSMLTRVRAYARTRNRGFVLCDAHTHGEYYDPRPDQPVAPGQRQLLFDFHSFPLRLEEVDTVRAGLHWARVVPGTADPASSILGQSKGGRAPGSWLCPHLPALTELDNYGPAPVHDQPGQWPWIWGEDEISWFVSLLPSTRDRWLVHALARVRELDPAAYLQIPGLNGADSRPKPWRLYRADLTSQADIIRALWAGELDERARRWLLIGPSLPGQ